MWRQIRSNRRRSLFVVFGMALLLLGTGGGVGVLVGGEGGLVFGAAFGGLLWLILWGVAVSGGDDLMLSIANAKEVPSGEMQTLRNVLEEMSIAAALPQTPRLFVIDDRSPNAFATGRDPSKSAVAVTTGLLAILDRDELQGVVAHEIAHIKNQDVRLMVLAGVMLGSIVMLADMGQNLLWYGGGRRSRSSSNDGGGGAIIAVLAIVVMVIGPLLAQLFYFSLSRRREYLADASAVAFTRYPDGLARALEKLGGATQPMRSQSRVTAPMYISAPAARGKKSRRRSSAFSTHPPIEERVRILRSMGGGAGLAAYEAAYGKVHGGGLMSDAAGADNPLSSVAARGLVPEIPRSAADSAADRQGQVREASDAMLKADGYRWNPCGNCGAVSKLPPRLVGTVRKCARCGTPYPAS